MQANYTAGFISLAGKAMEEQGDSIRKWAKSADNPQIRKVCGHILAATGQTAT